MASETPGLHRAAVQSACDEMRHAIQPQRAYVSGIEMVRCECGVWTLPELPCWMHERRRQTLVEARAEANQALLDCVPPVKAALKRTIDDLRRLLGMAR